MIVAGRATESGGNGPISPRRDGNGSSRRRRRAIGGVALRLLAVIVTVATSLVVVNGDEPVGAADIPYTYLDESFDGTTFPPPDWEATSGTWSASCTPAPAPTAGGCFALATVTTADPTTSQLLFDPAVGIPANLIDPTLTFTSTFSPDATDAFDSAAVYQPLQGTNLGDLRLLADIAGGDARGTEVSHTIPLAFPNLPLVFRWTSVGATAPSPLGTWGIANVRITGLLPDIDYALTANPIVNTAYQPVAGTPITITLSGSSDPVGATLDFTISTPPTLGQLGAVTPIDTTHATVVYTAPVLACPNPDGVAGLICTDSFKFTVSNAQGGVSAPANVALDVRPGGAGGQQVVVSAPATSDYVTLFRNGALTQGADLSGQVVVGPAGFPDAVELHIAAASGTIELFNGVASGVTFLNGTTSSGTQIHMKGSVAKLNTALGLFFYFPPAGTTPTVPIDFTAGDLGANGTGAFSPQATATTTVNGLVNTPRPVLTLPTGPLSIGTTSGLLEFPAGTATGFSLLDGGATSTTNDTVSLNVSGGTLDIPTTYTSGAAPLVTAQRFGTTLNLIGTVANLNDALTHVTFDPSGLLSSTITLSGFALNPDSALVSVTGTVPITVIQGPSVFGTSSLSTLQNVPTTVFLCARGPAGAVLAFTITQAPAHGTLVPDPGASAAGSGCSSNPDTLISGYTYTPTTSYIGADSFVYQVADSSTGLSAAPSTVAITVRAHTKPTAYPATATTRQDEPVDITLCGTNPDPAPSLSFIVVIAPGAGLVTSKGRPALNPCNNGNEAETVTWTPYPGTFTTSGADSFTYKVSNGADSDAVSVTIDVTTRTPHVLARQLEVDENGSLGFHLCSTTPNGAVTFSTVGPSHGTLDTAVATTNAPACPSGYFGFQYLRYVPTTLYSGPDQIVYHSTDGVYTSAQAAIDITVRPIVIPPTANPQTVTAIAGHSVGVTLTGGSVRNLPLTYRVVDSPTHGTLTGSVPNLTYTPSIASGTDAFTFVANDGIIDSAPATVTIVVVTPDLRSSACLPTGSELSPNHFSCGAQLTVLSDGAGGQVQAAHTSGARNAQLPIQIEIRNTTPTADTVTITGSSGTSPWAIRYATGGADRTADMTGSGVVVTLGPAGSPTASAFVIATVVAPSTFATPTVSFTVRATSGNEPSTSTSVPIMVIDGTSSPSIALTQANGTGRAVFPTALQLPLPLFPGGPDGSAVIVPGIVGTGMNNFRITSTVQVGSTAAVDVRYIIGSSTDVTSQVLAGTFTTPCWADIGCPTLRVVLTPRSGSGRFTLLIQQTSTIDGQSSIVFLNAQVAGSVGPDLYTSLPLIGVGVFEDTPATQSSNIAVQTSGTATKNVILHNRGDVSDTFSVKAGVTLAVGDTSTIGITAVPEFADPASAVDVTNAMKNGTYQVTIPSGDGVVFAITDRAGPTPQLAAAAVVVTATSKLNPAKVDAYRVSFPTYFYRPDAVLIGVNGQPIGAGVYGGRTQADLWHTSLTPTAITVQFADQGSGPWSANDAVVVKAPGSTSEFTLSYRLTTGGRSTDVTAAITGTGLDLELGANGSPPQTLVVSAASAVTGRAGYPGEFPITVTSSSSLPSPLTDTVLIQLYNNGASQLRFAGLPQPEPPDYAQQVVTYGLGGRVPPFPSAGYAPGITYGAWPDPWGQKFAYESAYDTFGLQIAAEKVTATRFRLQLTNPSPASFDLPAWARTLFSLSYRNAGQIVTPADPLGAAGVHPTITVNGEDVTSAVLAGTYTTAAMPTRTTLDLKVSFSPPAGSSQRFTPLRFALVNADTGQLEDVMTVALSTIVECSTDGYGQRLVTITDTDGRRKSIAFRSFDRVAPAATNECMQHLSNSWITKLPMVFSSYVAPTATVQAGGDNPRGLWFLPQGGIIRVDTNTLEVTSPHAKAYVDTALLADNADTVDPASVSLYTFVRDLPDLRWRTTDGKTGIDVPTTSLMPRTPFPLIAPSQTSWPGNTMAALRHFQLQTTTGTPVMIGEMRVNEPWFHGDVPFVMPVDNGTGLILDYKAPSDVRAKLPGDDSTENYGFFWRTKKDGKVIQGGCLGLPPAFFNLLGLDRSVCIIGAVTTFEPIPNDPSQEAKIANVTFELKKVYFEIGWPEFNLKSLNGRIDLDPATARVTQVVVNAKFGVGPETPCQIEQRAREAAKITASFTQTIQDALCPTNYFDFDAQITFKEGGFTAAHPQTGYGIRFVGTLSFLGLVRMTSVVADITTAPFNFHFANSPIDVAVDAGISLSARITLEGNVGENGFDISLAGSISVMGQEIASASGILSTKGMGICGGLGGVSVGFGQAWGGSPTFYPSGCTTSQYRVNA